MNRESVKKIYSANNDFQRLETLKTNRQKRHRYGEFVIEGVRCINSASAHGWSFSSLCYAFDRPLSNWAKEILAASPDAERLEMPGELMDRLSDKDDGSELIATALIPQDNLSQIAIKDMPLVVAMDRPASPGNLGTSLRSCDAFGVDGVIVSGHAADPYHPQAVRGSMGSLFVLPVVRQPSFSSLLPWWKEVGEKYGSSQIIGSSAKASMPLSDIDFSKPTLLVIGNETHGISNSVRESCDEVVAIPMKGWASSLNISCALSILLFHIAVQRG